MKLEDELALWLIQLVSICFATNSFLNLNYTVCGRRKCLSFLLACLHVFIIDIVVGKDILALKIRFDCAPNSLHVGRGWRWMDACV